MPEATTKVREARLQDPDFEKGRQSSSKLKPLSTEGGGPGEGLKGSQSPPGLGGGGRGEIREGRGSGCAKLEDKRKGSRIEGPA